MPAAGAKPRLNPEYFFIHRLVKTAIECDVLLLNALKVRSGLWGIVCRPI